MPKATALCILVALIAVLAAGVCHADGRPKAYIMLGPAWDLETDENELNFGLKFPTRHEIIPDVGLYNDKLLVGVQYNMIGPRIPGKNLYGGPGVVWYDNNWGGSLTIGSFFTRDWLVEGSYRVTTDWDGMATVQLGRAISW